MFIFYRVVITYCFLCGCCFFWYKELVIVCLWKLHVGKWLFSCIWKIFESNFIVILIKCMYSEIFGWKVSWISRWFVILWHEMCEEWNYHIENLFMIWWLLTILWNIKVGEIDKSEKGISVLDMLSLSKCIRPKDIKVELVEHKYNYRGT